MSAATCIAVLYGPYSANMGYHVVSVTESVLWGGLTRTAWSLGIAYLIISCHLGQGGKVYRISSTRSNTDKILAQLVDWVHTWPLMGNCFPIKWMG